MIKRNPAAMPVVSLFLCGILIINGPAEEYCTGPFSKERKLSLPHFFSQEVGRLTRKFRVDFTFRWEDPSQTAIFSPTFSLGDGSTVSPEFPQGRPHSLASDLGFPQIRCKPVTVSGNTSTAILF